MFKDFVFIPVIGNISLKLWKMGVVIASYLVKTWSLRYLEKPVLSPRSFPRWHDDDQNWLIS